MGRLAAYCRDEDGIGPWYLTPRASEWDTGHMAKASWGITKAASSGEIWLRFVGRTRTEEMPECLAALSDMMPTEAANIVFDLRALEGHNPETKGPIKTWLGKNRTKIKQITVLVPRSSTIHKVATAAISLAAGVKIRIRDDLSEDASVASL